MARMNLPGLRISQKSLTQPCLQGFSAPVSLGQEFWCPQTERTAGPYLDAPKQKALQRCTMLPRAHCQLSCLPCAGCSARKGGRSWAASSCKNWCHVSGGASRQRQGERGRTAILAPPSRHPPAPLLLSSLCTCILGLVPHSHLHS